MRLAHLLSYRHWQARLLMWGAAGAVGVAAVTFAKMADVAQGGLKRVLGIAPWTPWLLAPVGFFVIAWLTRRYFRGAEGRRFPSQRRALVLAGGAAGVAAAFNTPLAGIVFAIEELSRSFEERASGTTLTTVILAGVAAIALVGNYNYFGQPQVTALASRVTPEVLVVAAACGLGGGLFSLLTLRSTQWLPLGLQRLRSERPALFAGLCGLLDRRQPRCHKIAHD